MIKTFFVNFAICFSCVNILLRRFAKLSTVVKIVLFKAYYLCLYYTSLWRSYNVTTYKSCYNRCTKIFFGYKRRDSMSSSFISLSLSKFKTVIMVFTRCYKRCFNLIIRHLCDLLDELTLFNGTNWSKCIIS